jgi:hypothetical protein
MSNFFQDALSDVNKLEQNLLGPDYKYFKYIKSPEEMGMSASGSLSALAKDIGGLIGYVELLSVGGGEASKVSGPLGNKFFLETGAKCKDVNSGNQVTRSIYINNVPDGSIPFITSGLDGQKFTTFEGLIPGTMSNLAHINPMQMFQAFMTGTNPDCQQIQMETIDENNVKSIKSAFVTVDDINTMSSDWFIDGKKPTTTKPTTTTEKFTTLKGSPINNNNLNLIDYSKMPDDILVKVYYSSLGLLGLYILLRLFQRKYKK